MGDIRKQYDAALKAKIGLEAVKGDKTIREISSVYGVHPNQIIKQKKQLLKELSSIFSDKRAKTEKEKEDLEAELYRQIGQLKVELEWIKKNLSYSVQISNPKKKLSIDSPEDKKYPYLLKDIAIIEPDRVWSTDVTYIRMNKGFLYLVAIIDWYSSYILSWELSNTIDAYSCLQALDRALLISQPEIFNSDQGS